ncbi:uncharacterized protein L3040_005345 [Drepanopeziza brunnea f. sp. 'multigermtubi']|uniref:uncharacterized protein n=1 Tax=Drepanopeziza brunnea f. sp. 'multigermtubi' TaxID=698441 RepID=UPI00239ACC68|nr:hypothetical protein L3040_005345 [Drepanopeziza brunnea f. sp. 'multigermtubi']
MDHSSEASELALELRELQRWTSMLDESQRMTATLQMMRDATLEQVRVLMQVLREREAELTTRYIPIPDARLCTKDFPAFLSSSPGSTSPSSSSVSSINTTSTAPSSSSSNSNKIAYFHSRSPIHYQRSRSTGSASSPPPQTSRGSSETFSSPSPAASSPHYLGSPSPRHPSSRNHRFPDPRPAREDDDVQAQLAAQLTLINLTAIPLRAAEGTPPARPRKSLPYPRDDEVDPRWLRKWLHALRLHKYTACLEGLSPSRLLELHDQEEDLIERGICSIGARKKLMAALHEARENKAKA